MAFTGAEDSDVSPAGDGFGAANISALGKATVTGSLADGTAISQAVPIAVDSRLPLYVPLSAGKGSFFGWIAFQDTPSTNIYWFNPAVSTAKYYKQGFQREVPVQISPYVYMSRNRWSKKM